MKRVALFLITNLAVLVLLSVLARLFGLEVHSLRERNDAEAAAGAAPGVTKVENRIHVHL